MTCISFYAKVQLLGWIVTERQKSCILPHRIEALCLDARYIKVHLDDSRAKKWQTPLEPVQSLEEICVA